MRNAAQTAEQTQKETQKEAQKEARDAGRGKTRGKMSGSGAARRFFGRMGFAVVTVLIGALTVLAGVRLHSFDPSAAGRAGASGFEVRDESAGAKLAVEMEPLKNFFPAEEYHQKYLDKNPGGYCHIPPQFFNLAEQK